MNWIQFLRFHLYSLLDNNTKRLHHYILSWSDPKTFLAEHNCGIYSNDHYKISCRLIEYYCRFKQFNLLTEREKYIYLSEKKELMHWIFELSRVELGSIQILELIGLDLVD